MKEKDTTKATPTSNSSLNELTSNGTITLTADSREELAKKADELIKSVKGGQVVAGVVSELGWKNYSQIINFFKE